VPVVRPAVQETTALGAAYLAGLAVGYWRNQGEIAKQWKVDHTFEPAMKADTSKKLRETWAKALERSKSWEEAG
jgi:glycerol kinase